jgi:hypothetical protein
VARRSIAFPLTEIFFLRVRIIGSGRRSWASILFASTSSAADMVSKSMRESTSREEKVRRASSSSFWLDESCSRGCNSASVSRWLCCCSGFAARP